MLTMPAPPRHIFGLPIVSTVSRFDTTAAWRVFVSDPVAIEKMSREDTEAFLDVCFSNTYHLIFHPGIRHANMRRLLYHLGQILLNSNIEPCNAARMFIALMLCDADPEMVASVEAPLFCTWKSEICESVRNIHQTMKISDEHKAIKSECQCCARFE